MDPIKMDCEKMTTKDRQWLLGPFKLEVNFK